ncbi:MAG: protein TolQ [Alphaproteobacteria bacterium]|nr:protein TolQ [Rhodospirillaceae bacterium]MBT7614580.1 protein TolQ [Rhodospirillaceae bacterium]MBT7645810.1 protein TolQ [Rhodospirillaceae bacterium]MDG2483194.1 protein TolQ [Alphaproteobacteria bacterium]
MSVWSLFWRADLIVKLVMLILLGASVWSWAIIFDKSLRLRSLRNQASDFEESFWSGGSLEDLYDRIGRDPGHPMAAVFAAAMEELRRAMQRQDIIADDRLRAGVQQRINQAMHVSVDREMDRLERYMGFLATVGSTAPFVGLFGTVWGIMNAFTAIAVAKDTSLTVVAPGIAEALFATALGLLAAIPAVVAYNKLSSDLDRYGSRLETFAAEFHSLLSRQLDEKGS